MAPWVPGKVIYEYANFKRKEQPYVSTKFFATNQRKLFSKDTNA